MNQFMEHNWWMFACAGAYFFGMATVMAARLIGDLREDKRLPEDYKDLTRGRGYDENTDTMRILNGFTAPALPVPISPSPLLRDHSGGYATIGTKHLNVDQRYQTLEWLNRPRMNDQTGIVAPISPAPTVYQATVMRQHGAHADHVGRHRLKKGVPQQIQALETQTGQIDLNDVWAKINEEDSWSQQTHTSPLPARS
jgi:hypothetical protein